MTSCKRVSKVELCRPGPGRDNTQKGRHRTVQTCMTTHGINRHCRQLFYYKAITLHQNTRKSRDADSAPKDSQRYIYRNCLSSSYSP